MQWQLILETTMHAFDINALLTMMVINKLTDRTRKNSRNDRKRTQFFPPQCENDQCGSKNTHAAVPEKLTIFFGLNVLIPNCEELTDDVWELVTTNFD
jgi:hypothetical protein